jgi:hypothetical protein
VISQGADAGINISAKVMQGKFKKFLIKESLHGNPALVGSPPLSWGARPLDLAHVDDVLDSFSASFTINEDINVVRMVPSHDYQMALDTLKSRIDNGIGIGDYFLEMPSDVLGKGPYAESGLHSVSALTKGQQRYPNNDFFKSCKYSAYLVEDSEANNQLLAQLSILSNKKHMGKKANFKEHICRMIAQTEAYIEQKTKERFAPDEVLAGHRYELSKDDMDMFYRRWCTSGNADPAPQAKKYQQRFWTIAR